MNEEEIIELVEELKENCQCWLEDEDTCVDDRKWFEKEKIVLQNVLDLYNQEKEKNKKLEEENKYLQDYLEGMEGGLKEQIKEQQKQISELQEELEGSC